MSKNKIATVLFRMKKSGQEIMSVAGELFSVDELLTRYLGRKVTEDEGHAFLAH